MQYGIIGNSSTEHGEESFVVIDFMPRYRDGQTCRRPLEIHRILKPLHGRPAVRVRFEPRLNYARGETRVTRTLRPISAFASASERRGPRASAAWLQAVNTTVTRTRRAFGIGDPRK